MQSGPGGAGRKGGSGAYGTSESSAARFVRLIKGFWVKFREVLASFSGPGG